MSSKTIYLLPDYTLTLTADGSGTGSYYQLGAGNETATTINNNDVIVIGPFPFLKAYVVKTDTGTITPAKAFQNTMGFGANGGKDSAQAGNDIVVRVYNDTGSAIPAGKVVYFDLAQSGTPKIILAQADSPTTSPTRLAVTAEDIADEEYGFASTKGYVQNLDTSAYAVGDRLYLSDTTAGNLTTTAPSRKINVAQVIVDDAEAGVLEITVDIEAAASFGSLSGVDVAGAADNDVLQYDAGSGNWKDYTWSGTANQVTITYGTDTTTLSLPQDIATSSSPTFAGITINGNITVTGTVDGRDVSVDGAELDTFPDELKNLTTAEIQQLENINANTISSTQWGYLAAMDQSVATTADVAFERITIAGALYADNSDNTLGFFGATPATSAAAASALGSNLTNSMSATTTNGVLEDVNALIGNASAAAVERNFSEVLGEINATKTLVTAIRSRLITLGLWT